MVLLSESHRVQGDIDVAAFVKFFTGFTGSSARVFVTPTHQALFVDARYTLQAQKECPSWEVVEVAGHHPAEPAFTAWLQACKLTQMRIASDFHFLSVADTQAWQKHWPSITFVHTSLQDLVSPPPPILGGNSVSLEPYPLVYAGKTFAEKLANVIQTLQEVEPPPGLLITSPENIAWLFNIRAQTWPLESCSPTLSSLAYVDAAKVLLFVPTGTQFDAPLEPSIETIFFEPHLRDSILAAAIPHEPSRQLLFSPTQTSLSLWEALVQKGFHLEPTRDPLARFRCLKNEAELKGARQAHIAESEAISRLLLWLKNLASTPHPQDITEWTIAQKLEELRRACPLYRGPSFPSIVATGPNSALVHYTPKPETAAPLHLPDALLLDVGGHYLGGTTDTTRTLWLGSTLPPPPFRRAYTNVLKGHISLACSVFPKGTTGGQLDALARQFLWHDHTDYHHGTGHGVGNYLAVHEGPCNISSHCTTPLEKGMILSIEPGVYVEGQWGIRLENLYEVVEAGQDFLTFRPLTRVPFEESCIEKERLTPEEAAWLRDYDEHTHKSLSP